MPHQLADEAVLAAVAGRLNVAAMTALATGGVHNRKAPPQKVPPYVTISVTSGGRFDAYTRPGAELVVEVHAVTKDTVGNSSDLLGLRIISKAKELLHFQRPAVTGYNLVGMHYMDHDTYDEPGEDGLLVRHFVSRYRVVVEQTA